MQRERSVNADLLGFGQFFTNPAISSDPNLSGALVHSVLPTPDTGLETWSQAPNGVPKG